MAQESAGQQQERAAAEAEAEAEAWRLEEERRKAERKKLAARKADVKKEVKVTKTEPPKKKVQVSSSTSRSLSDLQALRLRLEAAEGSLSQHVHICLGDDGAHECGLRIKQLEVDTQIQKETQDRQACSIEKLSYTIFTGSEHNCICLLSFRGSSAT